MNKLLLILVLSLPSFNILAAGEPLDEFPEKQELLNGKTLIFEYTNGWGFYLSFYDNMIKYQFRRDLTNPDSVGSKNQDIPYRSRKIDNNIYQIMWHEKDVKDVVSMVINLNNDTLFAAGLLGYDENKMEVFEGAVIKQIIEE
jgi:phenolic acid decarboxylase